MGNAKSKPHGASGTTEAPLTDSRGAPAPEPSEKERILVVLEPQGVLYMRHGNHLVRNPYAELFLRYARSCPSISLAFWGTDDDTRVQADLEEFRAALCGFNVDRRASEQSAESSKANLSLDLSPVFVWGRSRCETRTGEASATLLYKPVSSVWQMFPEFGRNVLFVDNCEQRHEMNPEWARVVALDFLDTMNERNTLMSLVMAMKLLLSRDKLAHVSKIREAMKEVHEMPRQDRFKLIRSLFDEAFGTQGSEEATWFERAGLIELETPNPELEDPMWYPCFSGNSTLLLRSGKWVPIADVRAGEEVWIGLRSTDGHRVYRKLLRKWVFDVDPEVDHEFVQLAQHCLCTPRHYVFWNWEWQSAAMAAFWDRSRAFLSVDTDVVYHLELDGHEDVVCVGGVLTAAVGFFCSDERNARRSISSRRSRRCSSPTCKICDKVVVSGLNLVARSDFVDQFQPAPPELVNFRTQLEEQITPAQVSCN